MIVCICNAISEDQVRGAARKGAACPRAAYRSLGKEPQCCTCLCYAQEIIDDERANAPRVNAKAA